MVKLGKNARSVSIVGVGCTPFKDFETHPELVRGYIHRIRRMPAKEIARQAAARKAKEAAHRSEAKARKQANAAAAPAAKAAPAAQPEPEKASPVSDEDWDILQKIFSKKH